MVKFMNKNIKSKYWNKIESIKPVKHSEICGIKINGDMPKYLQYSFLIIISILLFKIFLHAF